MVLYIKTCRDLRNACAHGQVLFDMNLARRAQYGKVFKKGEELNSALHIANIIKIVSYLLGCICSDSLKAFEAQLSGLISRFDFRPNIRKVLEETAKLDLRV